MEPRFQGEDVVPGEYFLVSRKLNTFCYLTMQRATCCRFDTIPACDRQTDGIAVASTALAMRALRRAVKIGTLNMRDMNNGKGNNGTKNIPKCGGGNSEKRNCGTMLQAVENARHE